MTTTYTPIKKNTAGQIINCAVFSQATGQLQVAPTIAVGDFKRSIDGAAFANMDSVPANNPAGSRVIEITLSADETNCDRLVIIGSDQAGAEWDDIFIEVEITPEPLEDIPASVWDEILTAATHNVPTSAGRRLRQLASQVIIDGTAVTSTENTITLDGDASATDGAYDPSLIFIVEGTGAGQCRLILQYIGATKVAVVDRDWKVNPNATSEYVIVGNPGREHVNEGLAQGGTANTITLNALASASDDAYNGQVIFLRSGTGEDQANRVIDYDGTSKIATVFHDWDMVPDTTTAYVMLPTGMALEDYMSGNVWAYATRTLTAFGAGANDFVYTVTDSVTTLPIQGANVWISTDVGGGNVIWSGDTDANGIAIDDNGDHPQLDNGSYYFWVSKPGYTFVIPDLEVVP